MVEIKFRVKSNLFTAQAPQSPEEFDATYGNGSCIDAAIKELVRSFQTSVRGVYAENEKPTPEQIEKAIAETTPAKRQAVGEAKVTKSKKVKAIADAVKSGDLEEAKRLFAEMGFGE